MVKLRIICNHKRSLYFGDVPINKLDEIIGKLNDYQITEKEYEAYWVD